jgi:predicted nucleotide-binding protein
MLNQSQKKEAQKEIFLVHGHNTQMKKEILDFLGEERTYILENEPGGDLLSLMEKLEKIPENVKCAVILFSDDDFGTSFKNGDLELIQKMSGHFHYRSDEENYHTETIHGGSFPDPPIWHPDRSKLAKAAEILDRIEVRARQNVILELGYSWCKFGRDKVIVIRNEGFDIEKIQSDLKGIYPILWNSSNGWKNDLSEKLCDIGITVYS